MNQVPGGGGDGKDVPDERSAASKALERWSAFPVGASPRPVVLVGPTVIPGQGFEDGESKLAFERGGIKPAEGVPREPYELLRESSGERSAPDHGHVLVLRAATLGQADFMTDRGKRALPAWILDVEGALGPVAVMTRSARHDCWEPSWEVPMPSRGPRQFALPSSVSEDGMTLTFRFTSWPGNLAAYESAEVFESHSAVAVVPIERWIGPLTGWVTLAAAKREIDVRLGHPLDGRVLVDLEGRAVPVY